MTKFDKKWNMQCEQLVEYKRKTGHCMVPYKYKQDKSLGLWVHTQRKVHNTNKIRQDRKRILNEIGFTWKIEVAYNFKPDDKLWHLHYEKLVEFKRINGHCMVPRRYAQNKSLGRWVSVQRRYHKDDNLRQARKELLDALDFAWKAKIVATRSSTTDVRGLAI
jgi:uncharacterized protein YbgA (DUF1722 family)